MLRHRKYFTGILAAGILFSLLFFWVIRESAVGQFRQKVEADASTRIRLVQGELENVTASGQLLHELVSILDHPAGEAFSKFAARLQEIGPYLDAVIWASSAGTAPDFVVRHVAGNHPEAFKPGNSLAVPPEVLAAEVSGKNGTTAICSRSADGRQVTLFLPVFPHNNFGSAGQLPTGVAAVVFSPESLIRHALQATRPVGIPFDITDVTGQRADQLVFRWSARLAGAASWYFALCSSPPKIVRQFAFADRQWQISCFPNARYVEQNHPLSHWIIFAAGLLLSITLSIYISGISYQKQVLRDLNGSLASEIESRTKIEDDQQRLVGELKHALATVKTLEGILPICASCKKIRDDHGDWTQVDAYITNHSNAAFSHGICPECARKLYPDFVKT